MKKTIFFICFLLFVNCTLIIEDCISQWDPDVRLTNDPALSKTSNNNTWCVATNGIVVHAVWYDYRDYTTEAEIYYKRSADGGVTWEADIRLTNNSAWSGNPSLAVSGSNVIVVWQDSRDGNPEIYYKRSIDGGETWGVDTRLTNNTANSWHACVAVSGSIVHVVWQDSRDVNAEIYYKRSGDGGASWSTDMRMTNNTAVSSLPSVAVSGSFIHIVWYDERDGNREIYYKLSTDGGITWGTDTRMTNNTAASHYPSIAVSGSNVHIVWYDQRDGKHDIYYKLSADNGINWGADICLTNSVSSNYPSIAASGLNVHIVWKAGVFGNDEIFHIFSVDGGTTWGAETRLTNNTGISWFPSVAISGSSVHIVWLDERDGNSEIYYKRNSTGE